MSQGPSFSLPNIYDNPDGSWGPSVNNVPPQFKDIPYSPYAKNEKLGRFADWTENDGGRNAPSAARAANRTAGGRAARAAAEGYAAQPGTSSFAYFHVEDESSFSLVDNKGAPLRKGISSAFTRGGGRGGSRPGGAGGGRGGAAGRSAGPAGRAGARGALPPRKGYKDWEKPNRTRESSIPISPDWTMLEELDFLRLSRLRLEVDTSEAKTLGTYGRVYMYDKTFDRITPKNERPLQTLDRARFTVTTSEDPVLSELAKKDTATVYITDTILSWIMCATRSVYPWDIVITHENGKVFFDKRENGPLDYTTVNENAADPPMEGEKDKDALNSPGSLSIEATFIDQHFSFQVVDEKHGLKFKNPSPFSNPEYRELLASCGYRYLLYDLSVDDEEEYFLAVRTQVEAYLPGSSAKDRPQFLSIKTLNEFDSKAQGAGGAPDWRAKLESQRGAVVTTEMKNNSFKLAKYAVQSIVAGADALKIGYVSRANPRDNGRHVILATATFRPTDFATQLTLNLANGWGIVRMISDKVLKLPEGRYLLIKDPNKSIIRLYSVPNTATFGDDGDGDEDNAAE